MAGDVWYDPDLLSAVLVSDRTSSKPASSSVGPPSGSGDSSPASPVLLQRLDSMESRLSAIETLLANLSKSSLRPDLTPVEERMSSIEQQLQALVRSFNRLHDALKRSASATESDYESYLTVLEAHMKNILDRLDAVERKLSAPAAPAPSQPASGKSPKKSSRSSSRRGRVVMDISDGIDVPSGESSDRHGHGGVYI